MPENIINTEGIGAGIAAVTEWTGYFDGAIQSGYREADNVLKLLQN